MVILDIADKHHPAHVSTLPVYPPLGSTNAVHSAVPLPGRHVVVINDEALREYCDERDRELPQAAQVIPYRRRLSSTRYRSASSAALRLACADPRELTARSRTTS